MSSKYKCKEEGPRKEEKRKRIDSETSWRSAEKHGDRKGESEKGIGEI